MRPWQYLLLLLPLSSFPPALSPKNQLRTPNVISPLSPTATKQTLSISPPSPLIKPQARRNHHPGNNKLKSIDRSESSISLSCFPASISWNQNHHAVMKPTTQTSIILKWLIFSLLLFIPLAIVSLPFRLRKHAPSDADYGIRIRHSYSSYDAYIHRQLNKTLNPKLRQIWTTRDWDRKIQVFAAFFSDLKKSALLFNSSKSLCIGARVGQEVEALKRVGVNDSIGIDLVPYPPLVVKGDFHHQPFDDKTFDFEFSNVFDHALYPEKFVGEIERTLKPGGICVLHLSLTKRTDKYSANDLYSVKPLVKMLGKSDLVRVRKIDGFGLDTEAVFRRRKE